MIGNISGNVLLYVWLGNCVVGYVVAILQSQFSHSICVYSGNKAEIEVLIAAAYLLILNIKERNRRTYIRSCLNK